VKKQAALGAGLLLATLMAIGVIETGRAQVIYPGYPAYRAYPAYPGPRVYPAPGFADGGLPPFEVMRIVRASGFIPVTRPVRRGPYYVLLARDRGGRDMRVTVDARLGDIVNLRPAFAGLPYGPEAGLPPPGVAPAPPTPDLPPPRAARPTGEDAPAPPRATAPASPPPAAATVPAPPPAPAPAPAPTRSVAADAPEPPPLPPPPPLPRPRPKLTSIESPAETPAQTPAPAMRKPLFGGAPAVARDKNQPAPIE
jgi:hypothetical protein